MFDEEIGEVPENVLRGMNNGISVDMNDVVGKCDILFLCLDTLRYDVAIKSEREGITAVLNQYGPWEKCFAPGNFTYPSHHAMFAGFLPAPVTARSIGDRPLLFFPKSIGLGKKAPQGAFAFEGTTFVEGLAKVGYQTNCIGGVSFFDKRSPLGSVFPAMFQYSFWRPSFGCIVPESTANQVDFIVKRLAATPTEQRVFYYVNISAIHYPNWFYDENGRKGQDNLVSHQKALAYVDEQLAPLFQAFAARGKIFVIVTSDHGTCYGEDGFQFHGLPNAITNTVPYKHFFLGGQ